MRRSILVAAAMICLFSFWTEAGQRGQRPGRPGLFFREEWKRQFPNGAVEGPASPQNVTNPNLDLRFYGEQPKDDPRPAGRTAPDEQHTHGGMWMNHRDEEEPPHLFTGTCNKPCGMGLRHKTQNVDLSGFGSKIRWYVKATGYHQIRPVVKLADGSWLVGNHGDEFTEGADWLAREFSISDLRWRRLDINKVVTATGNLSGWVNNPDLSKVEEVGFVDLMPGSGHGPGGYSDFAWIEVYGKPVPR